MPKRAYGTGHLYEKSGAYYGRWRPLDGRQLNRKVGRIRRPGERDGLTRPQTERELRHLQDAEERAPKPARGAQCPTVDEVGDSLRQELRIGGARRFCLEGCESMQRVHISPLVLARWRSPTSPPRTSKLSQARCLPMVCRPRRSAIS